VFILGSIAIACSSIVCVSPHYFSFESLRNDTFYDDDKRQPMPFEYATEANVGIFRYQIMEVFEYPWPPLEQRQLFDAMHDRELERLLASDYTETTPDNSKESEARIGASVDQEHRRLQNKFPDAFYDDDDNTLALGGGGEIIGDDDGALLPDGNSTTHQSDTLDTLLTKGPSETPPPGLDGVPIGEVPDVLPGSNVISRLPTTPPTSSPTAGDPNLLVDVDIGAVKPYPRGTDFDSHFTKAQTGAMWAPILAAVGLFFCAMEFFCCVFKCSWLLTAACLNIAFTLQMATLFLFMSEDFCKYDQECALGTAGVMSVIAIICYCICQALVCGTPRPNPMFNLCKKKSIKKKKKKKKKKQHNEFAESDSLAENEDGFYGQDSYNDGDYGYDDGYGGHDSYNDGGYDDGGYNDGGYNDGYNDGGYNDQYEDDYYDDSQRSSRRR